MYCRRLFCGFVKLKKNDVLFSCRLLASRIVYLCLGRRSELQRHRENIFWFGNTWFTSHVLLRLRRHFRQIRQFQLAPGVTQVTFCFPRFFLLFLLDYLDVVWTSNLALLVRQLLSLPMILSCSDFWSPVDFSATWSYLTFIAARLTKQFTSKMVCVFHMSRNDQSFDALLHSKLSWIGIGLFLCWLLNCCYFDTKTSCFLWNTIFVAFSLNPLRQYLVIFSKN